MSKHRTPVAAAAPAASPDTAAAPAAPQMVRVRLDPSKRPGVLRVGTYEPNKVYTVTAAEADRLCTVKGFDRVADDANSAEG